MHSPVNWIGGKSKVAAEIIRRFPPHTCYVEPFAGGAHVFFAKQPSKVEVLNDLDQDLLNFYAVAQRRADYLARLLCLMPHSLVLFEDCLKNPPPVTPYNRVMRAARFWYLQQHCFAGRILAQSFGYGTTRPLRKSPEAIKRAILAAATRLDLVTLESLPFADVISRYDRPETLFYCDPPYWKLDFYHHNFTGEQHAELADVLRAISGMFILSYNDVPEIRALYDWADVDTVEVPYSAAATATKPHAAQPAQKPSFLVGGFFAGEPS